MRIQLFSDLHLERDPGFQPTIFADTDVVVLAGDIGSYQARSRLDTDDFGLGRFAPATTGAAARVLYARSSRSATSASSAPRCGPTSTRWRRARPTSGAN
jgi:hypothetical protein